MLQEFESNTHFHGIYQLSEKWPLYMREINLCGREKKFQDILFAKKIFVKQNKFSSLDFQIIRVDIIYIVHAIWHHFPLMYFGYQILLRNTIPLQWLHEIPEQKDFKLGEIRNWYICYSLVAPPHIQKYERDKIWLRCYHNLSFCVLTKHF